MNLVGLRQTDWSEERRQLKHRIAQRTNEPSTFVSDSDGTVVLTTAVLNAMEGEFEHGPHVMLALGMKGGGGRFLRQGDWGKAAGMFRQGTCAIALPETAAHGFSPKAHVLGLAIAPQRVAPMVEDRNGLAALLPAAARLHSDPLIEAVMIALWRDAEVHGSSSAFFDHGLELIIQRLLAGARPASLAKAVKPLSNEELKKATDFIDDRIGSNIKVTEVALELGRDMRGLTRAFRETTGHAPFEYITLRRMEHAKALLRSNSTIMDVALAVGYANPAKFAAAFRRFFDCSPSEWREHVR
ncbi:MAG: helix-turn-helix transcriptional regulator [Pannonibacter sp.]